MNNKPLHAGLRMVASGVLSPIVLFIFSMAQRDPRWCIFLGVVAAVAFVLLIPVLVRGNSWQKMVAGILLFVPSFGLVGAAIVVASSL